MKINMLLIIVFIFGLTISPHNVFGADWMRAARAELTVENEPEVDGVAIIKIAAVTSRGTLDNPISNAIIYCGIPEGVTLVNENDYKTERKQSVSGEWFTSVILYEGPMNKNEVREVIFKVKIPDEKKYVIFGGVTGSGDKVVEIDLGEPDFSQEPESSFAEVPSLETELKIRTKYNPSLMSTHGVNPKGEIPFRYLIYTGMTSPEVEAYCILPEAFEMVNPEDYKITQEDDGGSKILLYSGAMDFKETKAFYFKVKRKKGIGDGAYEVKTEVNALTPEGEEHRKTDTQSITFGRILY